MKTHTWIRRSAALGALALLASCDPGSNITFEQQGTSCRVDMTRNSDGFSVELDLACDDDGEDCYVVESLRCQGEPKTEAVPIDLVNGEDDCPSAPYCVARCEDGLEAPGTLWDMPGLLAVDGCNVYDDAAVTE